jgi:hypothetical protein
LLEEEREQLLIEAKDYFPRDLFSRFPPKKIEKLNCPFIYILFDPFMKRKARSIDDSWVLSQPTGLPVFQGYYLRLPVEEKFNIMIRTA